MNRPILLLLLLLLPLTLPAAEEGGLEAGLVNPGYVAKPDWFKTSFLDLAEDLAEADAAGKRLILYFYQDGCPYCEKLINTNFAQKAISDFTRNHFELVAINMWGDSELTDLGGKVGTEKSFAVAQRVQFTPTLLFLDEAGAVALRVNGYYPPHKFLAALRYVQQRREREESFRDYLARTNPRPAEGRLHIAPDYLQPPYDLSHRSSGKPLLLIAAQRDCPPCDEMEREAFQRSETRALLKNFDVAVVDIWGRKPLTTPDGRELSARAWAKELKVLYAPSLLFFDSGGKELFRTEAYLRPFHLQSALDYIASGAYRSQPEFQRYVQTRADRLREEGVAVDIWQ